MNTIQFGLSGGASVALPTDLVVKNLLDHLKTSVATPTAPRPTIGEYLHSQGGVYAGSIRGDDGVEYGLIISEEQNVGSFAWGPDGSHELSDWDGLCNTNALSNADHPAAQAAAKYERDGHCDFYLPSRREMAICLANVPHLFNADGYYWTSTSRDDSFAWVVGFEYGSVHNNDRYYSYRVRPVRRLAI